MIELQKSIASVASSSVRLLAFVPAWLSTVTVDSSVREKRICNQYESHEHTHLISYVVRSPCFSFLISLSQFFSFLFFSFSLGRVTGSPEFVPILDN